MSRRLFISFSGGETSAFMTLWILANWRDRYDEIVILFANTGQENEATLEFVRLCAEFFGLNIIWVEAVVHHGRRKSPTHRVVTFETASRDGAPFEEAIRKYGIPNYKFKDCTRNLKLRPMESYLKTELGWAVGTYDTALGIRADELDRIALDSKARRLVYPLATDNPTTKPAVNRFWREQPFRLGLKGYQGNCKWCWKKSLRKHLTLIAETPEVFDFPRRMEAAYPLVGPEFLKDLATLAEPIPADYRRVFFRESRSVEDLFALYAEKAGTFEPADDDAAVFDEELDVAGACGESCDVHIDQQADLFEEDDA